MTFAPKILHQTKKTANKNKLKFNEIETFYYKDGHIEYVNELRIQKAKLFLEKEDTAISAQTAPDYRGRTLARGDTLCLDFGAHLVGYVGRYDGVSLLLCLLQYIGPSFVLCHTCRRADSLAAPLALHMLINTLGCIFLR